MKFTTKLKLQAAKDMGVKLESQTLDDVTIYFLDGDELVEGMEVFSMNEDGEYIPFPDGEYSWGDKVVVVEDSIVKSINEKSGSEEGGGEMKKIAKLEAEVVTVEDYNILVDAINDLKDSVSDLGGDVVQETVEELKKTKQKLSKLEAELKSTKSDLKLAKETSNGEFENPEKKGGNQTTGAKFDPKAALAQFGL